MSNQSISKKSVKTRESGHYWVKWAGTTGTIGSPDIWRMGVYYADMGTWRLLEDTRIYYDTDFLAINENRIPFTTGQLFPGFWVWVAATAYVIATVLYILLILNDVMK